MPQSARLWADRCRSRAVATRANRGSCEDPHPSQPAQGQLEARAILGCAALKTLAEHLDHPGHRKSTASRVLAQAVAAGSQATTRGATSFVTSPRCALRMCAKARDARLITHVNAQGPSTFSFAQPKEMRRRRIVIDLNRGSKCWGLHRPAPAEGLLAGQDGLLLKPLGIGVESCVR